MYDELVKALRETDFSDGCPCEVQAMCKDADCVIIQAADAIEELQQTVEQMKATIIAEAQHTEMYDERDKRTLIEMAKSLPLQIIPYEVTKPRWIPVTERLPLYGQDVLAVRTYGDGEKCQEVLMAHIAVWNEETGKKWWNATNITHWMPLPAPPKEE